MTLISTVLESEKIPLQHIQTRIKSKKKSFFLGFRILMGYSLMIFFDQKIYFFRFGLNSTYKFVLACTAQNRKNYCDILPNKKVIQERSSKLPYGEVAPMDPLDHLVKLALISQRFWSQERWRYNISKQDLNQMEIKKIQNLTFCGENSKTVHSYIVNERVGVKFWDRIFCL